MSARSSFLSVSLAVICVMLAACAHSGSRSGNAGASNHVAAAGGALSAQANPENFEERAREVFGTKPLGAADLPDRTLDSDFLYKFLLAEIAGQRGNYQVAAKAYVDLAKSTRDPRVARRATEVALYGRFTDLAVEAAKIWLATEKDSTAARQTLAALFVNNNDLQSAKPLLQQMLAADGDNVGQSLMQLYPLLSKHSDKNAVLALVKELTKPYKDRPEAHLAVAEASLSANKYDAALSESREAMRLRPDWEAGALLQAQVLSRESRAKAIDYLKSFLDANPKAQEARLAYARQLINDKKYPEARAEFQRLLDDNPKNADIAVTVALLSVQMSDFDAAEVQLKRVLEMDYKDPDAVRFHLGQVNEERKRYDEAAKWYLSVEDGEQYVLAHARYAFMLAKQGKLAEARQHLQGLEAQSDAQRVQILQSEAQLMREAKDYRESYDILKRALDVQPDQPELLYDVALAAEKVDRIDVVESSLRRLIALKPDHAQAYNALGYTLADRTDRLGEARDYIEKALKLSPEDPFILDSMGWVEYRLGHLAQGQQYLERAFQQRPDPEIAAHLGEVLWVKGDKPAAEKVWRDALRDNPESDELQKVIKKYLR
ncbi:MAG TPA: tetratricopeptide repeat protein [Burkholderiales bacterium]|nr:tetratricopeptide repeat protein [Burkholderiales bacterium]